MVCWAIHFGGIALRFRTSQPRLPARPALPWVALALISGLHSPPAALAATPTTCSFDGTTRVATVVVGEGTGATLARVGDAISVNGVACETATVTTTDRIHI